MPLIAQKSGLDARVLLRLHEHASPRQYRDLGVFVRHCVERIERDVGRAKSWTVTIVPSNDGFSSFVILENASVVLATGHGLDGARAAWDALCNVEQRLRNDNAASEA